MSRKAPNENYQTAYVLHKAPVKTRQTVFILNEGEEFAKVFTDEPVWKNHLKNAADARPEDCKLQEDGPMVEYAVPMGWVNLHYYLDAEADRRHRAAYAAAREAYFAALDADPEGREEYFDGLDVYGAENPAPGPSGPASEPSPQPGE